MPLSYELQIGKAGEHLVCSDLILQGFNAFLADQGLPFDVLVETNAGLKKIQVKSTLKKVSYGKSFDVYRYALRNGRLGRYPLTDKNVDYFAFVGLDSKKIAYIASKDLMNATGEIVRIVELRDKSVQYRGRVYSNGTVRDRYGKFIDEYSTFPEQKV